MIVSAPFKRLLLNRRFFVESMRFFAGGKLSVFCLQIMTAARMIVGDVCGHLKRMAADRTCDDLRDMYKAVMTGGADESR